MTLAQGWLEEAEKFCRHGCMWAASYDHAGLGLRFRTLRSVLGRLREKRKRLALVGPFSAGKTSLLNKLMTEAGLKLPVGLSETTAIPTVVRPSDSVKMFLWNNENLVEADRAVLEEFLRLTRDNVGPILKMYLRTHDEVVLNVPMHRAFRDLEFVDLPGLLGSDARSRKRRSCTRLLLMGWCMLWMHSRESRRPTVSSLQRLSKRVCASCS